MKRTDSETRSMARVTVDWTPERDFARFGRNAGHCADRELEMQEARKNSRRGFVHGDRRSR